MTLKLRRAFLVVNFRAKKRWENNEPFHAKLRVFGGSSWSVGWEQTWIRFPCTYLRRLFHSLGCTWTHPRPDWAETGEKWKLSNLRRNELSATWAVLKVNVWRTSSFTHLEHTTLRKRVRFLSFARLNIKRNGTNLERRKARAFVCDLQHSGGSSVQWHRFEVHDFRVEHHIWTCTVLQHTRTHACKFEYESERGKLDHHCLRC